MEKFQDKKTITVNDLKNHTPFLENEKQINKNIVDIDKNLNNDSLRAPSKEDLEDIVTNIKKETKEQFMNYVRTMLWQEFKDFCVELIVKMGYGTGKKNQVKQRDGGIDGIVYSDILQLDQIYIQAKRYSDAKVSRRDMTDFIHNTRKSGRGIFLTTSDFSA